MSLCVKSIAKNTPRTKTLLQEHFDFILYVYYACVPFSGFASFSSLARSKEF